MRIFAFVAMSAIVGSVGFAMPVHATEVLSNPVIVSNEAAPNVSRASKRTELEQRTREEQQQLGNLQDEGAAAANTTDHRHIIGWMTGNDPRSEQSSSLMSCRGCAARDAPYSSADDK